MRNLLAVLIIAGVLPRVFAASPVCVGAPAPEYADSEASAEAATPGLSPAARMLDITLSLDTAAPASGAELRLGNAHGGRLSLSGTATVLAFENGEWLIRGDRHRRQFTAPAANPLSAGPRTLAARVRLDAGGAPVRVERLTADGRPLSFGGMDGDMLLAWLDPRRFDAFKVVSRGGAGGVSASVNFYADGTLMILR